MGFLLGTVGWEAGAKAGFDTNVSRSIDDGEGSGNLSAYGSYWKGHAAETRLDWTMGFVLQGKAVKDSEQSAWAFGAEVFKETADAHAFSVSAGIDWTRSWFSTANYTYRTWDGERSSATSSSGFAGIGYRF